MNKSLCIASLAFVLLIGQISAQAHRWTMGDNNGNFARDSRGGKNAVNGQLNNAQWCDPSDDSDSDGAAAVHLTGDDNSYVSFGNTVGQFGTQAFSVAFWFQTTDNSLSLADLIGNRAASGHGNFFAVRLTNDGHVSAEVDQDASGTNYIGFRSSQSGLNDGNWHHIVVTRSTRNLYLYVDGALSNSGTARGTANINNKLVFKVGRSLVDRNTPRFAPAADFADVNLYSSALSASQVRSLYATRP